MTFKDQTEVWLNFESKVNIISQAFTLLLGLKIWKTNVKVQKIDGTILKIYWMIVSIFSMLDKNGKKRLFEKSFVLANVKLDVVFEMFFFIMSNADINF